VRVRDGIVTLAEEGLVEVFVADAHRGLAVTSKCSKWRPPRAATVPWGGGTSVG
jgi:hypothetical protein